MKTIMNQRFYESSEIASMLSLSIATVRRYLSAKKIKGTKIGKTWHVREKDLKAFLNIPSDGKN